MEALQRDGWTKAVGNLQQLRVALQVAGAQPATTQRGRSQSVLRPYAASEAPPHSMSAIYGLEEQPLHTDGAHLSAPPDVIALWSGVSNTTPTLIWAPASNYRHPGYVSTGIFSVRSKGGSFLASAMSGGRLRFDPVCMSPGDGLARKAAGYFQGLRQDVVEHHWNEPDTVLLIDNRRCMHARGAVAEGDENRQLERLTLRLERRE